MPSRHGISVPRDAGASATSIAADAPEYALDGGRSAYVPLVVDDHAAIRVLVQKTLETAGYAVTTASDGDNARTLLGGIIPDLILLDLNLPGCSGWDLVQQLQATLTTPILLMSGHSRHEPALQEVIAQTQGYLEKPFDLDRLLMLVQTCLSVRDAPQR